MIGHPYIRKAHGFTIVELLIVVVVIAILAAIVIVSYNGVAQNANKSALKSDIIAAAKQLQIIKVETGAYPEDMSMLRKADSTLYQYSHDNTAGTFCLTATSSAIPGVAYRIAEAGLLEEGLCAGDSMNPGAGSSLEIVSGAPMQTVTRAQCQALPVYTGSNSDAIRFVTDSRGGEVRSYEMAKLADDRCWMLTNLRLGSATSTTTLVSADTQLADGATFILPQVTNPATTSGTLGTPQALGPVLGDTGVGASNYGYLYNWLAVTAGADMPSGPASNAPHSICPAGWRLPTANADGEFAMLNARMNNPAASTPSGSVGAGFYENWRFSGPFKGVYTGYWSGAYHDRTLMGYLWTSSTRNNSVSTARVLLFGPNSVSFTGTAARIANVAVRCIVD